MSVKQTNRLLRRSRLYKQEVKDSLQSKIRFRGTRKMVNLSGESRFLYNMEFVELDSAIPCRGPWSHIADILDSIHCPRHEVYLSLTRATLVSYLLFTMHPLDSVKRAAKVPRCRHGALWCFLFRRNVTAASWTPRALDPSGTGSSEGY